MHLQPRRLHRNNQLQSRFHPLSTLHPIWPFWIHLTPQPSLEHMHTEGITHDLCDIRKPSQGHILSYTRNHLLQKQTVHFHQALGPWSHRSYLRWLSSHTDPPERIQHQGTICVLARSFFDILLDSCPCSSLPVLVFCFGHKVESLIQWASKNIHCEATSDGLGMEAPNLEKQIWKTAFPQKKTKQTIPGSFTANHPTRQCLRLHRPLIYHPNGPDPWG